MALAKSHWVAVMFGQHLDLGHSVLQAWHGAVGLLTSWMSPVCQGCSLFCAARQEGGQHPIFCLYLSVKLPALVLWSLCTSSAQFTLTQIKVGFVAISFLNLSWRSTEPLALPLSLSPFFHWAVPL